MFNGILEIVLQFIYFCYEHFLGHCNTFWFLTCAEKSSVDSLEVLRSQITLLQHRIPALFVLHTSACVFVCVFVNAPANSFTLLGGSYTFGCAAARQQML